MQPTPEQQAIIAAASTTKSNLMVNSGAGCGKTTTLALIAQAIPEGGVAIVFQVDAKKALEKKLPKTWTAMTANGLGHRAWGKSIGGGLEVNTKKLGGIISSLCKGVSSEDWHAIRQLVCKAMVMGLVPKPYPHRSLVPDDEEGWALVAEDMWPEPSAKALSLAHDVLVEDIRLGFKGVISYDDQIYLSAMLGGVFPRFQNTIVDEAQDLSILNHIQVSRVSAGRLFVVGDPNQSIYQWRGAHSSSMEQIRSLRKDWIDLPLRTTFRCPVRIVARQQESVPGFTAHPGNAVGRILNAAHRFLSRDEEPFGSGWEEVDNRWKKIEGSWCWEDIQELGQREVAILCRNNAPLISLAFRLLRRGVGCKMLGRDIGKSLIALVKKLLPESNIPAEMCAKVVQHWQTSQVKLARANDKGEKVAGIVDRSESILAILEGSGAANAGELTQAIEALFSRENGNVTLSTIHKAKGLEWPLVLHLDPWRIPSRHAQSALARGNLVPMAQEKNLRYVCETRAQQVLVLVNLEDFT
jgi:superfamily I DNA/RNA helicase